jgi:putative lipoprotein (rSAM/lipoprotein system)
MKTKNETGRRILRKIYTGLGLTTMALVFQACYGTPQGMGLDVVIRGTVKKSTTDDPIEGIQVSVKDMPQYQLTDSSGQFQIYVSTADSYTVRFEDIDGPTNGSYQSKEIAVELSNETIDLQDIELDAVN